MRFRSHLAFTEAVSVAEAQPSSTPSRLSCSPVRSIGAVVGTDTERKPLARPTMQSVVNVIIKRLCRRRSRMVRRCVRELARAWCVTATATISKNQTAQGSRSRVHPVCEPPFQKNGQEPNEPGHSSMMSTYETLLTPATYVASDDEVLSSPEAPTRHRGRWKSGLLRKKSSSPQLLNSKASGSNAGKEVKKRPTTSNVLKRAIHKIGKKAKRSSPSHPPPSSSSAGLGFPPPKVRDHCLHPRVVLYSCRVDISFASHFLRALPCTVRS